MIEKTVTQRIGETQAGDVKQVEALVDSIRAKAYAQAQEVVRLAHTDSVDLQATASAVLMKLGALSIEPLLEAQREASAEDCVWDLKTAARAHLENRKALTLILEKRLGDKRPVQFGDPLTVRDEEPAPKRVCDEAYLVLRQLLSFKETAADLNRQEALYLDLSDSQRDAEIAKWLEAREFVNLKANPPE